MSRSVQLKVDLNPALIWKFPTFMECVRHSVSNCGRQQKDIAIDLGVSEAKLSRMLSGEAGELSFPLRRLPDLMRATRDDRPLQWLILSFLVDPATKRKFAAETLQQLKPFVSALLKESGEQEISL